MRAVTARRSSSRWLGGLGLLVRREYFRPQIERLAEAALRVTPAAMFYAVMQGDEQVGFASSTVDTSYDDDRAARLPRRRHSRSAASCIARPRART